MILTIPGRLPGMNDIVSLAKRGRGPYQPYAIEKEKYTEQIAWLAKKLPKHECVDITITWHEPNPKRDIDNIAAGTKFILDGLVRAGTLPDDSQKYIKSITHHFRVDRTQPRIEVEIKECEVV